MKNNGFTLFEVSIALLLLVVGILGMAKMQVLAQQTTYQAFLNSVADNQISNLFEQLLTKQESVLYAWQNTTEKILPKANSQIQINNGVYTVTLQWENQSLINNKNNNMKLCLDMLI